MDFSSPCQVVIQSRRHIILHDVVHDTYRCSCSQVVEIRRTTADLTGQRPLPAILRANTAAIHCNLEGGNTAVHQPCQA